LKFFLIFFIFLISNPILADLNLKINHHGNIINLQSLNKNQINLREVEFDKEIIFSSELIKKYYKHVSEIIPVDTFVVLYGDEDGVVNELDRTYLLKEISLSHTGEDHNHDPEIFPHVTIEIQIELDANQKSVFILQKRKTALRPITKLISN
jgi:hypothetical protein